MQYHRSSNNSCTKFEWKSRKAVPFWKNHWRGMTTILKKKTQNLRKLKTDLILWVFNQIEYKNSATLRKIVFFFWTPIVALWLSFSKVTVVIHKSFQISHTKLTIPSSVQILWFSPQNSCHNWLLFPEFFHKSGYMFVVKLIVDLIYQIKFNFQFSQIFRILNFSFLHVRVITRRLFFQDDCNFSQIELAGNFW